jgi:hypothetical protein
MFKRCGGITLAGIPTVTSVPVVGLYSAILPLLDCGAIGPLRELRRGGIPRKQGLYLDKTHGEKRQESVPSDLCKSASNE